MLSIRKLPLALNTCLLAGLLVLDAAARRLPADEAGGAVASKPLVDFASPDASKQIQLAKGTPAGSAVTVDKAGIAVNFTPFQKGDADHPGIHVYPAKGKFWDLAAYGHVEATITNTGAAGFNIVMHVSDEGDGYWTEKKLEFLSIKPGETKTLKVIFGYEKGFKPGAPVKTSKIAEIFIYLYHSTQPHSFRIDELKAAGPAGEKPPAAPAKKP
jgi:hypothetical protein